MMMIAVRIPLILAAFAAAATAYAQGDPLAVPDLGVGAVEDPLAVPDAGAPDPDPELKALADNCTARKFETIVSSEGRRRGSRVRICGKAGQTDADWLKTLRSSIGQTEANESLSRPVKDQIVTALKAEIGRLEGLAAMGGPPSDLPAATIALLPESIEPREPAPQYSSLPPLPTPKRAKASASGSSKLEPGAVVEIEPLIRPRLTIRCALPRESFVACEGLRRESQLLIRADEDLAAGTSIRFLRSGDNRAELELGALKKGETLREKLPGRVCSGVMRGRVQVQILSKSRVAETLGPYALYCGS